MNSKNWFVIAAFISFSIAALHVTIIFAGADAYRYFGAGEELAAMEEAGSYAPAALTACIAMAFTVCGLYALSGAGTIRRMPLRKAILIAITAIFLLRGTGFFIELLGVIYNYEVPIRHIVFSFVALATGVIYLVSLVKGWKELS